MEMTESDMRACAEKCLHCFSECSHTLAHCLEKGGGHADPKHVERMLDCARICATSAEFLLRHSGNHSKVCGTCAEICRACEADCRTFGDDEMMAACAEACRECAESCERMAGRAA